MTLVGIPLVAGFILAAAAFVILRFTIAFTLSEEFWKTPSNTMPANEWN